MDHYVAGFSKTRPEGCMRFLETLGLSVAATTYLNVEI